ncbi:hypothetical protein EFP84_18210 [Leptospira kmetyi]|uniref:Uncharacterized protein n=1 Tax=Leptospira kmetyi TaxID=408139 RepID=A0AAD0URT6_9LEPT|nr:hypothetical protein EFP84_18210 [Leptospira kmetyi]
MKAAERGISMKALVIEALERALEMKEAVRKKDAKTGFASNHHGWPVHSKQLTDIYLLSLSVHPKVKFATFDSKIPYKVVDYGKEYLEAIAA